MHAVQIENECPLCGASGCLDYATSYQRNYQRCGNCDLTFMSEYNRLNVDEERARYQLHQNDPKDPDYRTHLAKAINPLLAVLKQGDSGLDFGSGPGPTVSLILKEAGFDTENYDPFFAANLELLERNYDFVVCTEVAEHFRSPFKEFELLSNLVKKGGWLSLMTQTLSPDLSFDKWWYVGDPTHVSFYSLKTFEWIANKWDWSIVSSNCSVHLFQKGKL